MENKVFDFKVLENLFNEKKGEATENDVLEILGIDKLEIDNEIKMGDAEGDLITIVKSFNTDGDEYILYVRRSHINDELDENKGTFEFVVYTGNKREENAIESE